jgi:glycosyltransferase involved in cell wall biosynthesis/peptidoglycan/xylan/chitin deacetylase (PgdA/CDA1 family)
LTNSPSFSVIVPTYQRREVVCAALRALCRVDYDGPVEIIVVVDGSTDGTADAVAAIDCPFALRVVSQVNLGPAVARNHGAAEARHDILLFLDDDMICEPDLIAQHARSHRAGADAVIGDVFLDPDSPPGFMAESNQRWIDSTRERRELAPFDIFTGQLSVRRSVFEQVGGFDPVLTSDGSFSNEDADLGVRLLACCDVRHNPAAITRHRYVVSPRDLLDRAAPAAQGDLRFLRRHPQFTGELLEARGVSRPLTRYVFRPLAAVPGMPKLLGKMALVAAHHGLRTRWRSSRTLARFFSGARLVAYWSEMKANGWFPPSERLLVLCYHAIEDQSDDPVLAPYGVPPERFTAQIDWLLSRGSTFIGPGLLLDFLSGKTPLPQRAVLLTFDDGYPELLALARDVLAPRHIETLVFIVTGLESGSNEWDQAHGARRLQLLTFEQLKELRSFGVEVGSHSRTHRLMTGLSAIELEDETKGSLADLVNNGLPRPRFFAYPYGARSAAAVNAAREAGFLAAFGPEQGRVTPGSDHFDLPRVLILAEDHGWRFRLKVMFPKLRTKADRVGNGLRRRLSRATDAIRRR